MGSRTQKNDRHTGLMRSTQRHGKTVSGLPLFILALLLGCTQPAFGQHTYEDSLAAFRQNYKEDLYKIIKNDTAHLKFFPANRKMVVEATVNLLQNEEVFLMTTSSGKTKEAKKYAVLSFTLNGKRQRLCVYQLMQLKEKKETAEHLFLPFTDYTCNKESYGGGRYLDLEISDIQNNRVRLDFNKAYNPYCAFTSGYNCPIPPRENALSTSVKAGEAYQKDRFEH
jgi:uncharacterized protein (DUF1684 family)